MITFNWTISATERAVTLGELSDVIHLVHWRYRGTNEKGITAETYGATTIGDPNPQDFTPYNDLTAEDIAVWLVAILGAVPEMQEGNQIIKSTLAQMEEGIETQIEALANPKTITGPLYSKIKEEPLVGEANIEIPQ